MKRSNTLASAGYAFKGLLVVNERCVNQSAEGAKEYSLRQSEATPQEECHEHCESAESAKETNGLLALFQSSGNFRDLTWGVASLCPRLFSCYAFSVHISTYVR
ncbi:hypothetical protein LLG95_14075 [bacterium]|nr:hypothetical protein [bacterium]